MARKKEAVRLPKITQLPSGSWHTRCMVSGDRISITAESREEVIAKYMAMKHGVIEASRKQKEQDMSLEEALTSYIDARRGFRSPSTIYGYESYKRSAFQSMMHANIFTTTDKQWQAAIREEMRAGHSPKYIKNAWMLMSAAIFEVTERRPNVQLPEKEPNEKPFLDPEQIDTFVAAIKGESIEIPALLELSSLRRSEMLALTWDKVDLKNKILYVHGARVAGGENGKLVHKKQNKNDSSRRTVPIIPPLMEALESAEHNGQYVVNMTGGWICTRINEICAANNLPKVGNHGLRHSFASLAYHLQIPEKIAMEIGGWADDGTMHKIYTHLAQKDIAKRAQDFSDYFDMEKRRKKSQIGNENGNEK